MTEIAIIQLIILSLATWRISNLLTDETELGPFGALDFTRAFFDEFVNSDVLKCLWCCSVWVGMILTLAVYFLPVITFWICLPFALSTIAIFVDRYTG